MRDRPTVDLIFLTFAAVVGITVLGTVTATLVLAFTHPTADITRALTRIASIISTLTGAIVGYAAGTSRNTEKK